MRFPYSSFCLGCHRVLLLVFSSSLDNISIYDFRFSRCILYVLICWQPFWCSSIFPWPSFRSFSVPIVNLAQLIFVFAISYLLLTSIFTCCSFVHISYINVFLFFRKIFYIFSFTLIFLFSSAQIGLWFYICPSVNSAVFLYYWF